MVHQVIYYIAAKPQVVNVSQPSEVSFGDTIQRATRYITVYHTPLDNLNNLIITVYRIPFDNLNNLIITVYHIPFDNLNNLIITCV